MHIHIHVQYINAKSQENKKKFIKSFSLSDVMNDVLGVPLLVNFMTSSFVICFVGFQMTMDAEPDYMVKLFLFLFSSLAQIYLICHYGQLLIDAVSLVLVSFEMNFCFEWFCCEFIKVKKNLTISEYQCSCSCIRSGLVRFECALSTYAGAGGCPRPKTSNVEGNKFCAHLSWHLD